MRKSKQPKAALPSVVAPAALLPASPAPTEATEKVTLAELQAYVAAHHTDVNGKPITDWHPLKVLAAMSVDPNVKPETRAKAASEAASYLFARLRGIEIDSHHEETHTFVVRKEFSFTGGDGTEIKGEIE